MKFLLIIIMIFNFTDNDLIIVRDQPHKLGWMLGYNKLSEIHSKWIIDVWDKKIPLMAHRGSYKTTSVLIVGAIREFLRYPDTRLGVIRKTYKEAMKPVNTIVKCFEKPELKGLYYYAHGIIPRVIKKDGGLVTFNFKLTNTNEGSLNAFGIEDIKTGMHLDEAFCDDIITLKDRISKAARESTKEGIRELTTNIMDEGQDVMFDGTPWHKDDGWSIIPKPKKYDWKKTGIFTKKLIEKKRKGTTKQLFSINYELKHTTPDDAIFKDPVYGKWDYTLPSVYGHLDAKYKGDHTNGLTFMAKREDGRFQITGYTWPEHIDEHIKDVVELYQKRRCSKLWNEENADKGYLAKDLKKEGMKVDTYSEHWHKHTKIVTFLKAHWNELVWDENIQPEYMNQILDYMEGQEPDDCPDSAASLLRMAYFPDADYDDYW
jgi:hypothetical protein